MIDWTQILQAFIASVPVTITAIAALIVAMRNSAKATMRDAKVEEIHRATNGITAALVKSTRSGALSEGHEAGVKEERARKTPNNRERRKK